MSVGAPQHDRRSTKILHIEDNPENRALVRALLDAEGYTLVEAEDGLSGIEAALREEPALILLDINLPGVDGYEVGVMLKSFPTLATTPVIAVTAYAMDGDRQRTLVAGCDGYIQKPIDVDAFPREVAEFLRGKREHIEEREAGPYLKELNQRLVYRLVSQVEELKRLNQHFVRRAVQLEDLHTAVQDITSEMGVAALLERLLPALARALGTRELTVELNDPDWIRVEAPGEAMDGPRGVLGSDDDEWTEVEWTLPLAVRGRELGTMRARHLLPPSARSDEEQLLKIVANQVAIAAENARLYQGMVRRAAEEESLVEAGRLLTGTLDLTEVLQRLAELVRTRLAVDFVQIWLLDAAGALRFATRAGDARTRTEAGMAFRADEGTLGWILERRAPLVLSDLNGEDRAKYADHFREEGLASFLGVPLVLQSQAVGVLVAGSRTRHAFAPDEVALAEALSASAAAAIRNARLYEETQERLRQTETLLTVSRAVGATLDVAEVARRTLRELVRALGADLGGAWQLTPGRDALVPLAGYHLPKDLFERLSVAMPPRGAALLETVRHAGMVWSSESDRDPRFDHPLLRLLPHRAALIVPMRVKDETLGGFAVVWIRGSHEFTNEELRLVEGIVSQAAVAIDNARLLEAEREALGRLQVSETRYRDLFENAIDLVYVQALDGRILAFNQAGLDMTGYSLDEILGMNVMDLMGREDAARARVMLAGMLRGEHPRELFSFELVRKNGTRAVLECAVRLIHKDGVPVSVQGVARDVTERRKLERRQAAFVEIVKELAAEDDFDRLFSLIGRRACELLETDATAISLVEGEDIVLRGSYGIAAADRETLRAPIAQSPVARVLRDVRPHVAPNMLDDAEWRQSALVTQLGFRAALGVPIVLRGTAIGVLGVLHRTPRDFNDDDLALLAALAEHTAVALDRTNLLKTLEARLRETGTLLTVSQAAGSVLDVAEIARRTLREMVRTLGADMGGAWRAASDGRAFVPVAGYRVPKDLAAVFAAGSVGFDLELVRRLVQEHETVYASNSQEDPRFNLSFARLLPHRSVLAVPMVVQGEVIGGFVLAWLRESHKFTEQELRLVEGIARQAAIAIENARLLEAEREARERLAISETRYRELFDNVIDIVYLHDLDGRLLEMNEAGVQAFGYTRDELLRMKIGDFLSPDDRERLARLARRLAAGEGQSEPFVAEFSRQSGTRMILECIVRPVLKDGAAVAVLGSARDITVKRGLERRQEALVALSRELSTETDPQRLLPRIAEEARRLMGMDGAVLWMLGHDDLVPRAASGVDEALLAAGPLSAAQSLTGVAVRERRPLVYANLATDAAWRATPVVRDFGYRAMLAVPLTVKERTLGVLKLLHREPRSFPYEEVELLRAVATQAALAIDNARLFSAQREEAETSAGLLRLAEAIEGVQALDEVLDTVVRTTAELLGGTQCLLFLYNPSDQTLIPTVASGLPEEHRAEFLALTGTARMPAVLKALRTQDPVILEEGAADFAASPALVETLGVRSMLVIPLVSGGRLMGALGVHTPGIAHAFTLKEIALARGIAAHAAVAIDKARLFQQTQARLRETETLLTITQALSSTLDPTETMRRVAREIARALGADMVGAYLASPEQEHLRPIAGYRVPRDFYDRFMRYAIPIRGHAAMEEAWRTRHAVWTSDAGNDPRIDRTSMERFPHQSLLFVPMIVKGEPIGGFFVVWWTERRRFTAEEIRLVEGISDQAAMFIENARLYSEATRRRREAEELARLARMLTESLDAADVGQRIVESSLLLLGGRFSVLRLLQPDGSLKLIASKGDAAALVHLPPVIPGGAGVVGRAVAEGKPMWSANVFTDPAIRFPDELQPQIGAIGHSSYLAVPLRVKREIVGVIGIGDSVARTFSDAEVALLQTFADQAAIALENSRLYGDLRTALRAVEESQQRIVQGERLRALGEMAGGVAHDVNNVLAIIVGRAEVLLNETEDAELQRQLNVIIKVALDAAQTVKRIQEFTRMRRARPFQQVQLHLIVDEVVDVTRSRWKDEAQSKGLKYEMVVETAPTPIIAGDPSELREALINIVLNALDAMSEGGQLTLRTGADGDRVVVTVADSGVGMSEDVRQRIFDPFFTTKGERGTGLGLSVVYGIVSRHNGEIDVQSRLGHGTTFTLRFPVAADIDREAPQRVALRTKAKGRVLVIDDEREVADVLGDLLRRDGHAVVVCADGESGVARFEEEPFDLVVTDLGMPGMSGWEVARLVKASRPGTPVAMVTGWGDRIDPAEATTRGVEYIVAKTFQRDNIREVVAAALGAPPQRPPQRVPGG